MENIFDTDKLAKSYLVERGKSIEDARRTATQFFEGKSPERILQETGTAIGGVIGEGGKTVVLGADTQMTSGRQKIMGFQKIFPIDKYTAVGITGAVSFLQDIVKIFKAEVEYEQMGRSDGTFISPGGKANILASLVKQIIILPLVYGIGVGFLLGVYDPEDDEVRLFNIGAFGSVHEDPVNFSADGSGGLCVYSFFKSQYEKRGGKDMSRKNLIKLTGEAIRLAMDIDLYCGDRKNKEMLYVIDKNGVERIK